MLNECTICQFKTNIKSSEKISVKCSNCKALLNLNTNNYKNINFDETLSNFSKFKFPGPAKQTPK